MNMNDLAHYLLDKDNLAFLEKMLVDLKNDSPEIMYSKYKNIISYEGFLFANIDDYIDFIKDHNLNVDFLICSYLREKSYFIAIGGFHENIAYFLIELVNNKASLSLESETVFEQYKKTTKDQASYVFTDFDDEDNFF